MENKRKYILIFSILVMFLALVSVATATEVNAVTTKVIDKEKGHILEIDDWGYDNPKIIKKNGKYYIKSIKTYCYDYICKEDGRHYPPEAVYYSEGKDCKFDKTTYKDVSKLINVKTPKGYKVSKSLDMTAETKKFIKKNGRTSIYPNKLIQGRKIYSAILVITYEYNGKSYLKKALAKPGQKRNWVYVPKNAKYINSNVFFVYKGKNMWFLDEKYQ